MDPRGVGPRIYPCHGYVLPLYYGPFDYRPSNFFNSPTLFILSHGKFAVYNTGLYWVYFADGHAICELYIFGEWQEKWRWQWNHRALCRCDWCCNAPWWHVAGMVRPWAMLATVTVAWWWLVARIAVEAAR